jgi:hypothetical protein
LAAIVSAVVAFSVPARAETFSAIAFNNQSAASGVTEVTFQVNMGVQASLGNFNPASHTVEAHGSFDNWGAGITLSASPANTNIYQGTVNITGTPGTVIEHKYVINQAGTQVWEGNVGPGGNFGNRTFTLVEGSQILPVVYFNNLTNNPGAGIVVTFQANMSFQVVREAFDPATGVVDVRGPFNNWGNPSGLLLTNSPDNVYISRGTTRIATTSPGGSIPYKFTMNGTWESGADRTFVLASSDQVLPPRFFDDVSDLGPIAIMLGPFGDEVDLSWTGYARVRLQSKADLGDVMWEDLPGTLGASAVTIFLDSSPSKQVFRLIGP